MNGDVLCQQCARFVYLARAMVAGLVIADLVSHPEQWRQIINAATDAFPPNLLAPLVD